MKVILLRDVAKIGRKGQVVQVPDGYALNQLIPKKMAEAATEVNLKKIASLNASTSLHDQQLSDQFAAAVAAFAKGPLMITAGQVNDQGHLFKAIHEADIVAAAKQVGVTVLPAQILIMSPIKSLGTHEILLKKGSAEHRCVVEIVKN